MSQKELYVRRNESTPVLVTPRWNMPWICTIQTDEKTKATYGLK
jgi:hypothetical protein